MLALLNIDSIIFLSFLIINIFVGLYSSYGIKTIKEYAIGNRNFSTATISATLIATYMSGSGFFNNVTETYKNGLYYMCAHCGTLFYFLSIAFIFAPRMGEFLGKLSIAEAMGDLYGKHVRLITAIAGFIGASGMVAVQLKVAGTLFEYCFDVPGIYGVLAAGIIISGYASFGGIKSVTFTDVIQLFTFGTIIPTIGYYVLASIDNTSVIIDTVKTNNLFNYKEVFDFSQSKSLYYLFIFLYLGIPAFNPAIFQRISMAKTTKQVTQSFLIAGLTCMLVVLIISWISILVLSSNPNLKSNEIAKYILNNYSQTGLRGLTIAGIMAMVMSTADSYVNSTAVLFVHDFCKPLKIKLAKSELLSTRIASLLISIAGMSLAFREGNLLKLIMTTNMFYMPIVTIPFMMAILGFRPHRTCVLIGMAGGFTTMLVWQFGIKYNNIEGLIPGFIGNFIFLVGSHYILKLPGGWVGIKDQNILIQQRQIRKVKFANIALQMANFSLPDFFRANQMKADGLYTFFGIFCIISGIVNTHTLPKLIQLQHPSLITFIHISVSFFGSLISTYPLWFEKWKNKATISILWNAAVFYILICVGLLLVLVSNFAVFQLISFMLNMIIIALVVRWQWAVFMLVSGLIVTIQCFRFFFIENIPYIYVADIREIEVTYLMLFLSTIFIVFLKPKQEYISLTEEKNIHLNNRLGSQEIELKQALSLRDKFIRNINHEYHAPMTGILSTAQTLWESYDKLNDEQRRLAAENIFKSSIRLECFDANITTLSKLSKSTYKLELVSTDLSFLILKRLETCCRLYEEVKDQREFILHIEDKVIIDIDQHYVTQLIDNLIINAITYCVEGKIILSLTQNNNYIFFDIEDEGIGIPSNELKNIFGEFIVSSKTESIAGGRGVGLALCKRVIEVHGGKIWAENNGNKGTVFKFILPKTIN